MKNQIKAKAILFDMDGVLVDSEAIMCESAILALREWNVKAVPEDFDAFIGAGEDAYIGGGARRHGVPYATAMKDRAYAIYAERAMAAGIAFPGVGDLIRNLQAMGLRMGICSGADRVKVEVNIRALGVDLDCFACIVAGGEVARNKPAPDIYLLGLQKLGVAAADCVVVEDSVNGIQAGRAAGMRTIAIAGTFDPDELKSRAHPDVVLSDVRELEKLVLVSEPAPTKLATKLATTFS